jgi:large subunit ribosomal protein L12
MNYVYAALLLHKLGKPIEEESVKRIVEATGTSADESRVKTLVASLKGVDIDKAIEEAKAEVSASAAPAKTEEKTEEKKEEKHEMAAEGLAALFG